jgi:hypothetical protein
MSAELAEQPPLLQERYAASLSTIRSLGEASLSGVGLETAEELAYDDFTTKVGEMLKTDPELSGSLDVARDKYFKVKEGQVCAANGTPMVEIVRGGLTASQNADDPRLRETQAVRDEGDVLVAEAVDTLEIGQSMIVVSMEPALELWGKDALFWRQRGYRPGIAYIQRYSKIDDKTVCAAAYSSDHSDFGRWKDLLTARGIEVPSDATPNTLIRTMWVFEADTEEADNQAQALRRDNYALAGASNERLSVDEYLASKETLVRAMFDAYYPAVARALVSGKNQDSLREFASQALLQLRPGKLDPGVMRQIIHIANSPVFTEDMARAMDDMIPYALTEQLRRNLTGRRLHEKTSNLRLSTTMPLVEMQLLQQQSIHQIALGGIQSGLAAGRSYGGCSGTNLAAAEQNEVGLRVSQDVYGGADGGKTYPPGEDEHGPRTFKCTEGHINHRPHGKLLTECQHRGCKKGSVGCK